MSKLPAIPRTDDGAIDYAALGSELEANYEQADLQAFATKFWQSTDRDMRPLATFALFLAKAKGERLAGRIDTALVAERNAESIYQREIRAENKW